MTFFKESFHILKYIRYKILCTTGCHCRNFFGARSKSLWADLPPFCFDEITNYAKLEEHYTKYLITIVASRTIPNFIFTLILKMYVQKIKLDYSFCKRILCPFSDFRGFGVPNKLLSWLVWWLKFWAKIFHKGVKLDCVNKHGKMWRNCLNYLDTKQIQTCILFPLKLIVHFL